MTEDEFRAHIVKRLRAVRLSLGYATAASFARAIGYPPDKYSRYERRGIVQTGVLVRLVRAIKTSGHGQVSYNWLFGMGTGAGGPMFLPSEPQRRPPLRIVEGGAVRS